MKQLLDFIPLAIFFIVYNFYDIFIATGALMAGTLLQIIAVWFLYKKVERNLFISKSFRFVTLNKIKFLSFWKRRNKGQFLHLSQKQCLHREYH